MDSSFIKLDQKFNTKLNNYLEKGIEHNYSVHLANEEIKKSIITFNLILLLMFVFSQLALWEITRLKIFSIKQCIIFDISTLIVLYIVTYYITNKYPIHYLKDNFLRKTLLYRKSIKETIDDLSTYVSENGTQIKRRFIKNYCFDKKSFNFKIHQMIKFQFLEMSNLFMPLTENKVTNNKLFRSLYLLDTTDFDNMKSKLNSIYNIPDSDIKESKKIKERKKIKENVSNFTQRITSIIKKIDVNPEKQ